MFLPQRPYLPLGTLRAALAYPAPPAAFEDAAMMAALERCGLEACSKRLDDEERWDRVLSLGEQQRLAFARTLLHRPRWIFLDEATAALDEENQDAMMEMLRDELPETAVISIGHRPGLERHHDRVLVLEASPEGAVLADPEGADDGEPPRSPPPRGTDRERSEASLFSGALRALRRRLGRGGDGARRRGNPA